MELSHSSYSGWLRYIFVRGYFDFKQTQYHDIIEMKLQVNTFFLEKKSEMNNLWVALTSDLLALRLHE